MGKTAIYPARNGVRFIAYEVREGHWAVSRKETGKAEEFLRIYPTHRAAETLAINESGPVSPGLFDDLDEEPLEVEAFDCLQAVGKSLDGQQGLFG